MFQVFNQNYNDYMGIECCNKINSLYEFSIKCIKNLNSFLNYKGNLSLSYNKSCEPSVAASIEAKAVNYNKSMN